MNIGVIGAGKFGIELQISYRSTKKIKLLFFLDVA
jgi:hypothetical protein